MTGTIDQELIEQLRARLTRYCTVQTFDDALQEAMIRAWQLMSGSDSLSREQIVNKAADRGRAVVSNASDSVPLGKPTRDKAGRRYRAGDLSRTRIKTFQTEFEKSHGQLPTVTEVSQGLNMSTRNVRDHLQRMKTERKSMNVDERGRIREHLQLSGIEIDPEYMGDTVEFEETLLSYLSFFEIVAPLTAHEKELMYLCHVQGMNNSEVARCLGMSDSTTRDRIKRAHHTLRSHILTARLH